MMTSWPSTGRVKRLFASLYALCAVRERMTATVFLASDECLANVAINGDREHYFFLLFGFFTSFLAPCREAAIRHHPLDAMLSWFTRQSPFSRTSAPPAGTASAAGFTAFFSSLRCLFSSFFFFFASSFWCF